MTTVQEFKLWLEKTFKERKPQLRIIEEKLNKNYENPRSPRSAKAN